MWKVGDYVEPRDGSAVAGFVHDVSVPGWVLWRGDDGATHLSREDYVQRFRVVLFKPVRKRKKPTVAG